MSIIFKVIDYCNKETVGESVNLPIKTFLTEECTLHAIELFFMGKLAGKLNI
jgi:hypothetical protein